jgi:hypothetical protein
MCVLIDTKTWSDIISAYVRYAFKVITSITESAFDQATAKRIAVTESWFKLHDPDGLGLGQLCILVKRHCNLNKAQNVTKWGFLRDHP